MSVTVQEFDASTCPCCDGVWCNYCATKGDDWAVSITGSLNAYYNRSFVLVNDCDGPYPDACNGYSDTQCSSYACMDSAGADQGCSTSSPSPTYQVKVVAHRVTIGPDTYRYLQFTIEPYSGGGYFLHFVTDYLPDTAIACADEWSIAIGNIKPGSDPSVSGGDPSAAGSAYDASMTLSIQSV